MLRSSTLRRKTTIPRRRVAGTSNRRSDRTSASNFLANLTPWQNITAKTHKRYFYLPLAAMRILSVRGSKSPKSTISPCDIQHIYIIAVSTQKHRLPFHIVTPVVTIIHYNPFEYVSEAILQLNSLFYDTTSYTTMAIHSWRHRFRSGCQSFSLSVYFTAWGLGCTQHAKRYSTSLDILDAASVPPPID